MVDFVMWFVRDLQCCFQRCVMRSNIYLAWEWMEARWFVSIGSERESSSECAGQKHLVGQRPFCDDSVLRGQQVSKKSARKDPRISTRVKTCFLKRGPCLATARWCHARSPFCDGMFVVAKEVYHRCMFHKNGLERWVAARNLMGKNLSMPPSKTLA
jgi:hypothetical protein